TWRRPVLLPVPSANPPSRFGWVGFSPLSGWVGRGGVLADVHVTELGEPPKECPRGHVLGWPAVGENVHTCESKCLVDQLRADHLHWQPSCRVSEPHKPCQPACRACPG